GRKLKAATFIILALTFGTLAHRLNEQETNLSWRKSHLPSAKIWSTSFASEGFHSITNTTQVGRISRSLPSLTDTQGKIWKALPDWWAVETSDSGQPLIYCL